MEFTIEQIDEPRESFGNYRYRILRGTEEIAVFSHSYRGECELIRTCAGHEEDPPFGMISEFMTGGGPEPLKLREKAKAYLTCLVKEDSQSAPEECSSPTESNRR